MKMTACLPVAACLFAAIVGNAARIDGNRPFSELGIPGDTGIRMPSDQPDNPRETVVLLHGVGLAPWAMRSLERRLLKEGYRVLNIGYPSRTVPLDELAGLWLPTRLSDDAIVSAPRMHFVTHSMGSLLVRHLMEHARPPNTGRVVMIAPPNQGSALADAGRPKWLVRWLVGVNLKALGKSDDAFWHDLPQRVDYPVGVIAGTGAGNPLGRNLPKPHDGTVTVADTRIEGSADSVELPWSHTGILFHRRTADEVVHFLRHGKFLHQDAAPASPSGD